MELFARLSTKPLLATEMVFATTLANFLALATPLFVIQVLNRYVAFGVGSTLATLIVGVVIAIVLEFCFRTLRTRMGTGISEPIDNSIASNTMALLLRCKLSHLTAMPVGLRQQIIQDTETLKNAYNSTNIGTLMDMPFIALFLVVLAFLSIWLFIVATGGVCVLFILGYLNLATNRRALPKITQNQIHKKSAANSALNTPAFLRAFNGSSYVNKLWGDIIKSLHSLSRHLEGKQQLIQTLTQTTQAFVTVLVIAIGAKLVVDGDLNVGALIGANILAARALMPVARFNGIVAQLIQAEQARGRLLKLKHIPGELQKGSALKEYKGKVEFEDVRFAYPGDPNPIFESLNLELNAGDVLAVTGPNGCGKTTFCEMLLGLIEPTRGHLSVDNVELRQIVSEWWRKQVSYVAQDPDFIDGTIRDNIAINTKEVSEEDLRKIIDKADLENYLDKTEKGARKIIRENGGELAAGIRRRIALARALATNGQLVVLDEPTESLDPEGKKTVLKMIDDFIDAKKTLVIASYDDEILEKAKVVLDIGRNAEAKVTHKK